MRPFTVLLGIVMGSAASITFGLVAVLIIFAILAGRHPELMREMPQLLSSLGAFTVLTTVTAGSFVAQAKGRSWRLWAHLGTALCLAGIVFLFWPRRS